MEPADGIRRLGFTRWYERRLIEAHAWLISALLCLITIAACLEGLATRGSAAQLLFQGGIVIASIAIGIYCMARYQSVMAEAEALGALATCVGCGTYARFALVAPLHVRCRKCRREWQLIPAQFERGPPP